MIGKIYVLIDPITNEIRYVGQTRKTLENRLYLHWRDRNQGKEKNQIKAKWIRDLYDIHQLKPLIQLIENVEGTEEYLNERERFWIDYYFQKGCLLTNTNGKYFGINVGYENKKSVAKKVYCYDRNHNEQIFKSARDANRELNISYKQISSVCKKKKTNGNYAFSFKKLTEKEIDIYFDTKSKTGIGIIATNLKTKERMYFASQQEASKYLQCNFRNINQVLRGLRKSCKGYIFKYQI